MGETDVWMPLYIGAYMADTSRLSTEQHGAYLLLIMDYWRKGPPPDDDEVLSSIAKLPLARWKKHRTILERFFNIVAGVWHHKRIDEELEQAAKNHGARSSAGKAGALARWKQTDRQTHDLANGKRSSNAIQNDAPSPSPKEKEDKAPPNGGSSPEFWNFGTSLLTEQGLKEGTARSFLGSLLREYEEKDVEQALRSAAGKADAKSYVLGVLRSAPKRGEEKKLKVAL